ncbi:hypothetical protein CON33_21095 [Bacillus anthracis]|nr:hypothetical protein CON33_21095 [Bacillus anthracis]PGP15583.1 hypothetical protein CN994_25210 [Bacillus anthracis]
MDIMLVFQDIYKLGGNLSEISSWMGIFSFLLTIVLLFTTKGIKEKVQASFKIKAFKQDKKGLSNELESIKNLIISNPQDDRNLYDLASPLRTLGEYKEFMEKEDKKALKELLSIVKSGSINGKSGKAIYNLGVLIGFLKKRIDMELNNI